MRQPSVTGCHLRQPRQTRTTTSRTRLPVNCCQSAALSLVYLCLVASVCRGYESQSAPSPSSSSQYNSETQHSLPQQKVVLLDTTSHSSLDWTRYPYGPQSRTPGWVEESFTNFEQGINWRSYVVCDVAYKNVNNWLWTPFIERQDANRIYIEIKFSMRDCNLFPGMALSCKETFSLLYYEFDGSAHKEPPPWEPESYKLIDRIAADEGRFTSNSEVIINTEIRSIPVTKKGVYFAFRDQGACLSVIAIKIYYMVCPNVINNFALFPETPTGKELTAIVPAEGQCVANAVQIDQPRLLCKGDGNWTLPSGGCKCMAGYEPVGLACKVCPPATFKPVTGDELCGPCPAHSSAPYRGSTECRCDHGFHRAPKDPKWLPCTQPPSAPRNLTANFVDQATVLLSWSGPTFTGGRNDTVYRVECEACSTAVSFFPSQRQLNITRVTVSNLSPGMTYRFQVFAENGASLHETGQSVDIAVTTESTGYISLVITEDGVGQQKYNKEKEIKYNDSAAKSIDTAPKSSSSDFGLIVGVCVAILVLLVVISSMVIPYLRRSANECKKKQPSDCDTLEYTRTGEVVPSLEHPPIVPTARFNSPFSAATPLFTHFSVVPRTYVDPHTYEDPNHHYEDPNLAVREFTKDGSNMRSIEAYMEKSYELSSLPSYNQHMNMKMNSPQRTLGRDNNGRRELTLARMSTNNLAAPGGPGMADPPHHGQPTSTFGGHGHPHLRTRLGNSRHNMSTLQMHKNGQSNSTLEQLSPVYFSSNDRIV